VAEELLERLGRRFDELTAAQFNVRQSEGMRKTFVQASREVNDAQRRTWRAQAESLQTAIRGIGDSVQRLRDRRQETLQALFGSVVIAYRSPIGSSHKLRLRATVFDGKEANLVPFKQKDFIDQSEKYLVVLYYFSLPSVGISSEQLPSVLDSQYAFSCAAPGNGDATCQKDDVVLFAKGPPQGMRLIVQEVMRAFVEESRFKNIAAKAGFLRLSAEFDKEENELQKSKEDLCRQYKDVMGRLLTQTKSGESSGQRAELEACEANLPLPSLEAALASQPADDGIELFVHSLRNYEYPRLSDYEKESKLADTRREEAFDELAAAVGRQIETIGNLLQSTSKGRPWTASVSKKLQIVSAPIPTERYTNGSLELKRVAMQVNQVRFSAQRNAEPPRPTPSPAPAEPPAKSDLPPRQAQWQLYSVQAGQVPERPYSEIPLNFRRRLPASEACTDVGTAIATDTATRDYVAASTYLEPQFWLRPASSGRETVCRLDQQTGLWRAQSYDEGNERALIIFEGTAE